MYRYSLQALPVCIAILQVFVVVYRYRYLNSRYRYHHSLSISVVLVGWLPGCMGEQNGSCSLSFNGSSQAAALQFLSSRFRINHSWVFLRSGVKHDGRSTVVPGGSKPSRRLRCCRPLSKFFNSLVLRGGQRRKVNCDTDRIVRRAAWWAIWPEHGVRGIVHAGSTGRSRGGNGAAACRRCPRGRGGLAVPI